MSDVRPPRWSLDSIYTGFDDPEFVADKKRLGEIAHAMCTHAEAAPDAASFNAWLDRMLELEEQSAVLHGTLSSFCHAVYTMNTADARATAEINAVDEIALPFAKAGVMNLDILAANETAVRKAIASNPAIGRFAFMLEDSLFWQKKQMTAAEEDLAADLARSGADAWSRLQEQLISSADCLWNETTGERKTLVDLRLLAHSDDRSVREKAYRKELEVCAGISLPVAACINGVKGTSVSLNARRHWDDSLAKSIKQGRLSVKALSALTSAMEEALPHWRRYLAAKAKLMGLEKCAFYDLFAPVGGTSAGGGTAPAYDWNGVRETVCSGFDSFSSSMGDFARRAFDSSWIDAEPRPGKIGGAYCTDFPKAKEPRVMCNFNGTFDTVSTVAHELGHAFHAWVMKDLPVLEQSYPMTLAETASIFAETIVFNAEIEKASNSQKLRLLETHLQDGCQILVDILSRFYFECDLFDARKSAEVPAAELCAKMIEAQKKTYGDGLHPETLHPYMWLVKPHYYSSDLGFYNFPYAFGQLFALALYARFRKEGPAFTRVYENLLLDTGRMDAVDLTSRAGFDIEDPAFWKSGISVFIDEINQFASLVEETVK